MNKLLFLCILFITNFAYSQNIVSFQYELMKDSSNQSYLDFVWGTDSYKLMKNLSVAGSTNIEIDFVLNLEDENKQNLKQNWSLKVNVTPENMKNTIDYLGRKTLKLNGTNYRANLKIYNMQNKSLLQNSDFTFKIPYQNSLLSPIKLAYLIQEKSRFSDSQLKEYSEYIEDDLVIVPNPYNEYFETNANVYFYWQKWSDEAISKYVVNILDGAKREIAKSLISENLNDKTQFSILSIDTLSSGVYYLSIDMISENGLKLANSQKKFYIINKDNPPSLATRFLESLKFEESEFASLDENKLDYEFERMKYILSKFEINQFVRLGTLKAKQRAIFQYWKTRDPDTTTRENERLEKYNQATEYANTYFSSSSNNDGWKTDRGRILLKYGFPSEKKEYQPKDRQRKTEEWLYPEIQGGAYFYFVDIKENGNLQLVHSTAQNEARNSTWIFDFNAAFDENSPVYINQMNSEEVKRKSK